jgi:hypothetical protein
VKSPEFYLKRVLGAEMDRVSIAGYEYSLEEVVGIPRGDLEETLYDHSGRVITWKRILSKLRDKLSRCNDDLEHLRRLRFIHYWNALEDKERAEMKNCMYDEDPPTDPFRRKKHLAARVTHGVERMVRWRRNFTDELVHAYVHNDADVIEKKRLIRKLKREIGITEAIVDTLEHRMRCISHLCARHRA